MSEILLYEPSQSNILWRSSWLALLTASYAYYRGHFDICLCSLCIFTTSLLFWQKPGFYWTRYLDMSCVKISVFYIYSRSISSVHYWKECTTLIWALIVCYMLSVHWYKKNRVWESIMLHLSVHIIGAFTLLLLCSGEIEPIEKTFEFLFPIGCLVLLIPTLLLGYITYFVLF